MMNALYRHLTAHNAEEALVPNLDTKPGQVTMQILCVTHQKNDEWQQWRKRQCGNAGTEVKILFQDKRKTQTVQNILGLMGPGKLQLRIEVCEGTGLISRISTETIYCTFI